MAQTTETAGNGNGAARPETLPAAREARKPALVAGGGGPSAIIPRDIDQAYRLATAIAAANMAPKAYDRDANKIMIGIMHGMEAGFTPMAALQSIAVINGMPAIWGDGMLALVRGSGLCLYVKEWTEGEGDKAVAWCETRRKDEDEPIRRSFSMAEAEAAGLTGKQGPWTQYPRRMLQMRARSFCLRDAYADVLRGLRVAEEVQDIQMVQTSEGAWEPAAAMASRPRRDESTARAALCLVDETGEVTETEPLTAEAWVAAYREAWEAADLDRREALKEINREAATVYWPEAGETAPTVAWNELAGSLDLEREAATKTEPADDEGDEGDTGDETDAGSKGETDPEPEPEIKKLFIAKNMDTDDAKAAVESIYKTLREAPSADWVKKWRRFNETPLSDLPPKARTSVGKAIEQRMAELS